MLSCEFAANPIFSAAHIGVEMLTHPNFDLAYCLPVHLPVCRLPAPFAQVRLRVKDDYPHSRPEVNFLTIPWHPNVSQANGHVCLNTLNASYADRGTGVNLYQILCDLQGLLAQPNWDDPLDSTVLAKGYEAKAREQVTSSAYAKDMLDRIVASLPKHEREPTIEVARPANAEGVNMATGTPGKVHSSFKFSTSSKPETSRTGRVCCWNDDVPCCIQ